VKALLSVGNENAWARRWFVFLACPQFLGRAFAHLRSGTYLHLTRSSLSRVQVSKGRAMGLFTKDIQTMDDLLLHGLQDIYYAENQIVKSLPKLARA
jgi:D-serine deaminase-like pyridoxal phosphate-dependent protein